MSPRHKLSTAYIVKNARQHYEEARSKKVGKVARLHSEAEQLRWIVLAMGCQPHKPPEWAVQACIDFRKAVEQASQGGANKKRYGVYLDRIVEGYLRHNLEKLAKKPSLKSIIERVILVSKRLRPNSDGFDALYRAIFRAWKDEGEGYEPDPVLGLPWTPRVQRVFIDFEARKYGHPGYEAAELIWKQRKKPKM